MKFVIFSFHTPHIKLPQDFTAVAIKFITMVHRSRLNARFIYITKCDNSLSLCFFFVIQQTTKLKTVVFSVSAIDIDTGVGPNAQGNKEVIFDIVGGDSVKILSSVKHHILISKIQQPARYT